MSLFAYGWLHMQWTHEAGHALGAAATGGHVQRVVLHPAGFSRTDVAPNPSPLAVVWAGPVAGSALGVLASAWLLAIPKTGTLCARAIAGYCLIANGTYIGLGPLVPAGDTEVMTAAGTPGWAMVLFGVVAIAPGAMLWKGLRFRRPGTRDTLRGAGAVAAGTCTLAIIGAAIFPGP